MTEINYTNTIPEIKRAYALFRRKYALPRMLPMTVLLIVTIIFGIDFIRKNPSGYVGYILTALSAGMLISLWSRPFLAARRLISTIEALGKDEKYIARFLDDRIEIDTEIIPLEAETETVAISGQGIETVENPKAIAEAEQELIQADTSVYRFGAETLCSVEDSELFCLFVNKALFHIFPKRCMTSEQIEAIRTYFAEKL
ncbi:MAG: YcxB family protein [Oscillospiraceae bacterium]|nr:YcxB family protein [Oscillospiraceae bacterium]